VKATVVGTSRPGRRGTRKISLVDELETLMPDNDLGNLDLAEFAAHSKSVWDGVVTLDGHWFDVNEGIVTRRG